MVVTIKNYFHNVLFGECHVLTVWLTNCELCVTAECRKCYRLCVCVCTVQFHTENHFAAKHRTEFPTMAKMVLRVPKTQHNLDLGKCNDL